MKLSQWARKQGIHYKTAWKWFKEGKLPVRAYKTPSGSIFVDEYEKKKTGKVVLYARVSSRDQVKDLERQVNRLRLFASKHGLVVDNVITEIGSGLNGKRKRFFKLLKNPDIETIIVEHRDRAMRFGYEYLEATLQSAGRKILVVDNTELKDDLVQDMIDVLTSFCARLYGRRSAKNRVKKALEAMQLC